MTNEELLSVAEIVERATNRFNAQAVNFQERCNKYEKLMADMKAEHEAKMFEHRAAFGARTKADAETIDRLHTERDALRAEVADLKTQLERLTSWAAKNQAARETLQTEMERLRSENQIMRNDAEDGYAEAIKVLGDPIALSKERDALRAEVEVGDTVKLVKRPTKQDYELSWLDDWGKVGESFRAVSGVCTYNKTPSVLVEIRGENYSWPLSCVEVVTEATHDTEAGKAAAESAVKSEPEVTT